MKDRYSGKTSRLTLANRAEIKGGNLRLAGLVLSDAMGEVPGLFEVFSRWWSPRYHYGHCVDSEETLNQRAAWGLIHCWTIGKLTGSLSADSDLSDAERWFCGELPLPSLAEKVSVRCRQQAEGLLRLVAYDSELSELLPYVLDLYGPGSRASILKDPGTRRAQQQKRETGIFYTPADVAAFMISECHALLGPTSYADCNVLDPACGTGVFLRAALNAYLKDDPKGQVQSSFQYACGHLFGLDINPLAIDAACSVLLHDSFESWSSSGLVPLAAWHLLRLNFSAIDATKVTAPKLNVTNPALVTDDQGGLRAAIADHFCSVSIPRIPPASVPSNNWFVNESSNAVCISSLFPRVIDGFDLLVGNPPYSKSYKAGSQFDLYPVFVEMMWQIINAKKGVSALVVPLSIAYHQGKQYKRCRQGMMASRGKWRFAFFDREPHALFGEDVKTRNAVIFYEANENLSPTHAEIFTTPLQKWTSRTRDLLLRSQTFTRLENNDIGLGIPKLGSSIEASVLRALAPFLGQFRLFSSQVKSEGPVSAFHCNGEAKVYLTGTAYNFLGVFRPHLILPPEKAALSESPLISLTFRSESRGKVAFAVLSSRLAYWWWRIHGDGFHVSRSFINSLPFDLSSFCKQDLDALEDLGAKLWDDIQLHPIISLNAGRTTITYSPLASNSFRDQIDSVLVSAVGLDSSFGAYLRDFVKTAVVVDMHDARRNQLIGDNECLASDRPAVSGH